jgi:hypothetical protein
VRGKYQVVEPVTVEVGDDDRAGTVGESVSQHVRRCIGKGAIGLLLEQRRRDACRSIHQSWPAAAWDRLFPPRRNRRRSQNDP